MDVGYADAALGSFSSCNQVSRYVEGSFVYTNAQGYIQDNWKVSSRLTLDDGAGLVSRMLEADLRRAKRKPDVKSWSR